MSKIWKFEFQKSFQKNNVGGILAALLLLSGLLFFFQHQQSLAYQREYRDGLQADIDHRQNRLVELNYGLAATEDTEERILLRKFIKDAEIFIEMSADELRAFESLDNTAYLKWFNNRFETNAFAYWSYMDSRILETTMEEMALLQVSGAQPMRPLNYVYLDVEESYYTIEEQELWQSQNPRFYDYSFYYVWYLIEQHAFYIFLALIIILFGGFLRSERTGKRHSLDFLYTQSVSPLALVFSKFSVSFLQSFLLFAAFILGVIGFGWIINDLGSLDYPVVRYIPGEGLQPPERVFVALGTYLQENFILMLVGLLFMLSLLQLYNLVFKSEIIVVFTGLVTLAGGIFLPVHPYNPFTYLDTSAIVKGQHMYQLNEYAFSVQNGVGLLLSLSVVLTAVSLFLMKKTDLR